MLPKSSLSPNSISSILFLLAVMLISSANIRGVVYLRHLANHQFTPKIEVVPELNPEGSHKILLLDQIVYPGSTLYNKCFLVSTLIVSFNICFHFSFSVPLSDQNYECLS